MSYDIECYLFKKPWFPPKTESGDGWQVLINGPFKIHSEDIQDDFIERIGSRRVLLQIHSEGNLPEVADTKVNSILSKLVARNDAIIFDMQNDVVWDRYGKKQLSIAKDKATTIETDDKIITLSFYFDNEKYLAKAKS